MSDAPDAAPTGDPTRRLLALMQEHPALGLTSSYLVVSLLGLSYEWTLFRHFGVNYFHYADVTDFLMGAFREPITFLLALSAVLVGKLAHMQLAWEERWFAGRELRSWWLRAYRRYGRSGFNQLTPIILFLLYCVLFIWIYADNRADSIRGGDGTQVQLTLAEAGPGDGAFSASLLGTSSRFLFIYETEAGLTWVIPHENLAWLRVAAPEPAS
ncbi:MAG: hypothetical protein WBN65_08515 [Gammaproteobacteria bacterium]